MDADQAVARIRTRLDRIHALGVTRLAVFGSVARGEAIERSDLDVLVAFEAGRKSFDSFMEVKFLLEDLFPGVNIDLVLESSLNAAIRDRVLKESRDVA